MFTIDFTNLNAWTQPVVGGKAHSLARLRAAGVHVPDALCITTEAYRFFCDQAAVKGQLLRVSDPPTGEEIQGLVALFTTMPMPQELLREIGSGYARLVKQHDRAVAVRSSATIEDSATASFAGQFETTLNVHGSERLDRAVRQCWASLWSPDSADYRERMDINARHIEMAVVVQLMVDAEVSGVLFTKNPMTGDETQMLLSASWGLGRAIVSGEVTPDEWVLAKPDGHDVGEEIGDKRRMVIPAEDGVRLVDVDLTRRCVASISPSVRQELFHLGLSLETRFGSAQDIEWAKQGNTIFVLQSRPITT